MFSPARSLSAVAVTVALAASAAAVRDRQPDRQQILDTMKRASTFMVDTISTEGGYVWAYLPDRSRRWGELEAFDTMIWIQPPGTATVGHLYLDAYHATGDEWYYDAARGVARALIRAQHPAGGWNYLADFAGAASLQKWYDTIGRNAWRLEEFQHDFGNATFDDAGTAEAAKFLLRLYAEKRDASFKPALDKAIAFVLDSQYHGGGWPQRYPASKASAPRGKGDYPSYITFNDDVASENIEFLTMCYQMFGDDRLLDAIQRGMRTFVTMQQPKPQAGWALQYTLDLKPAGARSYEPKALVTHTTATNVERMIGFYRLTGDTAFLERIPDALAWLEKVQAPAGVAPAGRTHPTFIELDTDRPLYVHRRGSNVVNGEYYVDHDPARTIGHYSAFRRVDLPRLKAMYEEAKRTPADRVASDSPFAKRPGTVPLPRFFTPDPGSSDAAALVGGLNAEGYWPGPLGYNSHPYTGPGSKTVAPGDFATTHVGDASDTSPYPDPKLTGISTATFIRNMAVLMRALPERLPAPALLADAALTLTSSSTAVAQDGQVTWRLDNLSRIGGHAVKVIGSPRVVETALGPAIEFNGRSDGLVVETNPILGLPRFTIEVLFEPDPDGAEEQRFLHVEQDGGAGRSLIELRVNRDGAWALDTYLRTGEKGLTLLDRARLHPPRWTSAALTYDGTTMAHYVDGVRELSGEFAFAPAVDGVTSIGVRRNLVSWFKGRIHTVRFSPEVVAPERMLRVQGDTRVIPLWSEGELKQ